MEWTPIRRGAYSSDVTFGLIVDLFGTAMQAFIGVHSGAVFAAFWQWVRQVGIVSMLIPLQTDAEAILPK